MDAILGTGGDFDLERDFVDVVGGALDVDVELDVEVRLDLPLDKPAARSDSRPTGP